MLRVSAFNRLGIDPPHALPVWSVSLAIDLLLAAIDSAVLLACHGFLTVPGLLLITDLVELRTLVLNALAASKAMTPAKVLPSCMEGNLKQGSASDGVRLVTDGLCPQETLSTKKVNVAWHQTSGVLSQ